MTMTEFFFTTEQIIFTYIHYIYVFFLLLSQHVKSMMNSQKFPMIFGFQTQQVHRSLPKRQEVLRCAVKKALLV